MLAESKRLEKEINRLDKEIKKMPEGKLVCTKNDTTFKWYVSINNQLEYIPKKKWAYAEKLAVAVRIFLYARSFAPAGNSQKISGQWQRDFSYMPMVSAAVAVSQEIKKKATVPNSTVA